MRSGARRTTADVDWPSASEGGRVHGHEGVQDYWIRQQGRYRPRDDADAFSTRSDCGLVAEVQQVARSLDGALLDKDVSCISTDSGITSWPTWTSRSSPTPTEGRPV